MQRSRSLIDVKPTTTFHPLQSNILSISRHPCRRSRFPKEKNICLSLLHRSSHPPATTAHADVNPFRSRRAYFSPALFFRCTCPHQVVCDTSRFNFARIGLQPPATDTSCLGSMPGAIKFFFFRFDFSSFSPSPRSHSRLSGFKNNSRVRRFGEPASGSADGAHGCDDESLFVSPISFLITRLFLITSTAHSRCEKSPRRRSRHLSKTNDKQSRLGSADMSKDVSDKSSVAQFHIR